MSFAGQIKTEISRQIPAARHCRAAEMAALFTFCGTAVITEDEDYRLIFVTEHEEVYDTFLELLRRLFRILPEDLVCEQRERARTKQYRILIVERGQVFSILRAAGVIDDSGELADDVPLLRRPYLARECCRRAYLKGAFLAAGAASDPKRSYHAEIICSTPGQAGDIADLLDSLGIWAGTVLRHKTYPVYLKDGEQIADLLGLMDARTALFSFENARILKEMRGNINRQVNCETANIQKAADAAASQIRDILYIEKEAGLDSLPAVLDEMARLRLQYPSATLQELGAYAVPPIGKSGVNHRLRRISAAAEDLRAIRGEENTDA